MRRRSHSGRDRAIDATRGLAIWSMISLHFAAGTVVAAPTHAFPYVDGMSAFVLLSGLVLGIVYQRWVTAHGLTYALRRLVRRVATLYACQLFLSLVAVAAAQAIAPRTFRRLAHLPPDADPATQLEWAATLRYLPSGGNILALYLLLMAAALAVVPLLAKRLWPVVLGGSLALFAATMIWPTGPHGTSALTITAFPGGPPVQNWAAWQVLFIPAIVIGWRWDAWRVPERIDRRLGLIIAITIVVGLTVDDALMSDDLRPHLVLLIDKVDLGPARALLSFLVVTCVYGTFRAALRWMRRDLLRPLVVTGARSLDSYVVQAVCLLAIPILVVDRPWKPSLAIVIALAVFAACWVWAELRTRWGVDKLHRAPMLLAASVKNAWAARQARNGERETSERQREGGEQAGQEASRLHR
ncbi:OpgC domain-containing protein [Gordonia hydrophobica]|uniref:OpgC domain-containing protein n=1 Tax=Gordonia hydrophobica TaxID=40516 RepID=A0ABZ2U1E4_9ACTN|nr:OpgC domain-containing protein [Gordonia hydrophobica]MBM7368570.1 hypothetical protein [Gordonia hydrophobica]